jgi:hypothetical protein
VFPVTSGTPEGSINSPRLFNLVYKAVLDMVDVHELPDDLSNIDPSKVYYVVYADDLTFLSLDLAAIERVLNVFAEKCSEFDLQVNTGKTKWMAFLPEQHEDVCLPTQLRICLRGEPIENVDTFTYLGYDLDCHLSDRAHVTKINNRLLKASRAVGQLMRDLQCSSLQSLRKYFVSLVMSQLYAAIFVDETLIEFSRAVGIFVRTALSLPSTFPNVVCVAMLHVKSVEQVILEQRMKFLIKLEGNVTSPSFSALLHDRCTLMAFGVGLSARLGAQLQRLDVLPTIDYRESFSALLQAMKTKSSADLRASLLASSGRALWTELTEDGQVPHDLAIEMAKLPYEQARVFTLFLAGMLRWTALKMERKCQACSGHFSSSHFFMCDQSFLSGGEWSTLIVLCQNSAWNEVIRFVFEVLARWVERTDLFRESFALHVLEFVPPV